MSRQHASGSSGAHDHFHAPTQDRQRLVLATLVIAVFVVVQGIGVLLSGSLALLADTGHMASDLIALIVSLIAAQVALRPATSRHTYGFRRFEVFGAGINAVLLVIAGIAIAIGGVLRLFAETQPEIDSVPMLIVAIAGLVANLVALAVLHGGQGASMNVRGAYLHVLGDSIGSVLVIAAAVVIWTTGFVEADAIASLVIAALIIPRGLALLWQVQRVLSESAPDPVEVERMREHLLASPGVLAVHDMHAWQLTEGELIVTAHVQVDGLVFTEGRVSAVLTELSGCLDTHFGVRHTTLQLEPAGYLAREAHLHD